MARAYSPSVALSPVPIPGQSGFPELDTGGSLGRAALPRSRSNHSGCVGIISTTLLYMWTYKIAGIMGGRMSKRVLGEFEHQVLLAILRRGSESYSVEIVLELEEQTGRDVSAAAVLVTLGRLKEKGFLQDRMVEPGKGGGHPRRYFSLTERALVEMRESRQRYLSLWRGMEGFLDEPPEPSRGRGQA